MPNRSPPFTDDAGRELRAIDLNDLPGRDQPAMKRLLRNMRRSMRKDARRTWRVQGIGLVAGIAVLFVFGYLQQAVGVPSVAVIPVYVVIIMTIVVSTCIVTLRVGRSIRRAGLARSIASHGFCGGCGYDLREQEPAEEGLVLCAECGARWTPARLMSAPIHEDPKHGWDPLGRGKGRMTRTRRLTHDDRGALMRSIRSNRLLAPRAARKLWTRDQRRAVARARRKSIGWRLLATLPGALLFLMSAFLIVALVQDEGLGVAIPAASIPASIGIVIVALVWLDDFGVNTDRFVTRVRDAGLCGACGLPLDLEAIDADGYCICKQCYASWTPLPNEPFNLPQAP